MKFKYTYRILVTCLFFYFFYASINSFSGYDPNMGSGGTNSERYTGGILIGTAIGLPISIIFFKPFASILNAFPEIWVLVIYNIFNMILGYYTWIRLPEYLFTKIKKLKNSNSQKH